ncbi:MAG: hypothetical protein Kow0031_13620 [Anaerolineae bacterium]
MRFTHSTTNSHKLLAALGLLAALCGLSLLAPPAPVGGQPPTPDPRFGLVQTFDDFPAAAELNPGFTRIKLYWDILQPNGPDDWMPSNVPDPLVAEDLDAGRQVIGLIVRTPAWARDPNHPANDPANPSAKDVPDMDEWAIFVRKLVTQYEGRIHHWIIWNEPDVWDKNHPGSTWNGSVEDFVTLHKTAYHAIKEVDPQAKVYLPGLTWWWDAEHDREQYLTRLLNIITADPDAPNHNNYFDGVIYHLYYKPRQIFEVLSEVQAILQGYGLGHKTIWLAETNAPPANDPQEPPHYQWLFDVSLTEQASFMLQVHALAFAAGVERVQVYKLYNSPEHPEDVHPFGLLRGDKSRRPAFTAYQLATTWLAGWQQVNYFEQGDVVAVVFERPTDTVTVLWNWANEPREATLQAIDSQGTLIDQSGHSQTLTAKRGRYRLTLPPAECFGGCFIGGPTFLLVEQHPPDQRFPLAVEPTPTPTPTPVPSPIEVLAVSPRRQTAFWGLNGAALLLVTAGLAWLWRRGSG